MSVSLGEKCKFCNDKERKRDCFVGMKAFDIQLLMSCHLEHSMNAKLFEFPEFQNSFTGNFFIPNHVKYTFVCFCEVNQLQCRSFMAC